MNEPRLRACQGQKSAPLYSGDKSGKHFFKKRQKHIDGFSVFIENTPHGSGFPRTAYQEMEMSDKIESIFHATMPVLMIAWLVMLFIDLAKHVN